MNKKILASITTVVLFLSITFMPIRVFATSDLDNIQVDYTSTHLDHDILLEKALTGELVNNDTTQVSSKKIQLDKDLFIETIIIKQLDSHIKTNYFIDINNYSITTTTITKSAMDGGYSTKTTISCKAQERNFGNNTGVRLTSVSHKWEQLDSQFRVDILNGSYRQTGGGYNDNGINSYYNSYSGNLTTNNPTTNTTYSKSTGFTNWMDSRNGLGGLDTKITYSRFTGSTYNYYITINL